MRHAADGRDRHLRQDLEVPQAGDRLRRHRQSRRRARPHRAEQGGDVRRGADRARRCRAARLHLRHHRRAEGDDAFPSRSADHRRRLCQGSSRRDARRYFRRLAAARLHLRPRRAGDFSAALRRHGDASGKRFARQHDRDHRDLQGDHLVHRADGLPRHAGGDESGRQSVVAARGGVGRRDLAGAGVQRLGAKDRQADPRRHRLDRDAAHLHLQPLRRRRAGHAPADRSAATRPRSSTTT